MKRIINCLLFVSLFFLTGCMGDISTDAGDEIVTTIHPNESLTAKSGSANGSIVKTYENTIGAVLGNGYNSVKDSATQLVCINYDAPSTFDGGHISSVGRFTTYYDYKKSESTADISSSMNVSVGATVDYGMFSGSASGDVLSSTEKSSHDVYVYAYIDVTGPAGTITNVRLKDEFKPQYDENGDPLSTNYTPSQIYDICGDYYAGTITTGGRLHAVLQFSSSSESEKQQIKTEVTAALENMGSITSSSTSALSSVATKYNATVTSFATGCKAYIVGNDMESFQSAVDGFPQMVTDCVNDKNTEAVSDNLSKKTSLSNIMSMAAKVTYFSMNSLVEAAYGSSSVVTDLLKSKQNIATLINMYTAYKALDTDIQAILDSSYLYDWTDPAKLSQAELNDIQDQINLFNSGDLDTLQTAMNICAGATFSCEVPASGLQDISDIRSKLPSNSGTYPHDCLELSEISGLDIDESYATIYLNGDSAKPISVWCANDNKGIMSTYIDLNHNTLTTTHDSESITSPFYAQGSNSSGFINYWHWKKHHSLYWSDLMTVFRKIKIHNMDKHYAYVDICDTKYATSATYPISSATYPVGNWFGCSNNDISKSPYGGGIGSIDGRSKKSNGMTFTKLVDLTGTPFIISDDMIWRLSGSSIGGSWSLSDDNKSVTVQVQGNNGYFQPRIGGTTGPIGIKLRYQ